MAGHCLLFLLSSIHFARHSWVVDDDIIRNDKVVGQSEKMTRNELIFAL